MHCTGNPLTSPSSDIIKGVDIGDGDCGSPAYEIPASVRDIFLACPMCDEPAVGERTSGWTGCGGRGLLAGLQACSIALATSSEAAGHELEKLPGVPLVGVLLPGLPIPICSSWPENLSVLASITSRGRSCPTLPCAPPPSHLSRPPVPSWLYVPGVVSGDELSACP
jgi:hypothetical protein